MDADAARHDPNGFYHGMPVRYGEHSDILTGPPMDLIPGQPIQPLLFDQC